MSRPRFGREWHDYAQESDQCAEKAKQHANATAVFHRELIELYGKPAKTQADWMRVSQLIVSCRAGYDAAAMYAQLSQRAAVMADLMERTER